MKTIGLMVLLASLCLPAAAQDKVGTTAAPFLGIGVGARATAMGGAQVATAQGPNALLWNPSGITQMTTSGVELTNGAWFDDAQFQNLALVLDLGGAGHLGLSVLALNYGEIEVTTIENPEGTGERFTPLDLAVGASYARALTDRFSVGGTVKFIQQRIWNEAATGAAVDLGVNYLTGFKNLRIGMTLTNFGTSMQMRGKDLRRAIDIDPNSQGNNDRLPANLEVDAWSLPLMFRVGLAMDLIANGSQRLTASLDALAPSDNAQSASFGAEYAFRSFFFVRGGYRQAFATVAEDGGWTAGFGLRYALNSRVSGTFDYTFQQYEPFGTPQMFTLGVTF